MARKVWVEAESGQHVRVPQKSVCEVVLGKAVVLRIGEEVEDGDGASD